MALVAAGYLTLPHPLQGLRRAQAIVSRCHALTHTLLHQATPTVLPRGRRSALVSPQGRLNTPAWSVMLGALAAVLHRHLPQAMPLSLCRRQH